GLALLWLWLRTVSLPEILAHAHVHSWWAVALMVVLFLVTSMIRARRWLLLLRPLAPVGMVRAFAMNAAGGLLNYVVPIRSGDAAVAGQVFAFRAGARGLWTPQLTARLAGLTVLALVIDAFNFTLLFIAVGISVPPLKAMAAYPALLLSFAVPAGPGYLGNLEVAGALVLGGGLGLAAGVAAGAIVLYHALTAAYALTLGV